MGPTTPASAPALAPDLLPAPPSSILPRKYSTSSTTSTTSSSSYSYASERHAFPVDWLCSTCGTTHSVLEILEESSAVTCECENPTLQAVYDQFGRIFLYWRNDPAIMDLRDPASAREAAWRVAEAAGGCGERLRRVLMMRGDAVSTGAATRLGSRVSQESLSSSEASEDVEMSDA